MSFGCIPCAVGIVICLSGPAAQAKPSRPSALDWAPLERVLETFVDDRGLVRYSALKLHRADLDRAIAEIERARALDPLSSRIDADVAGVFYMARQYDRAIEAAHRTLEMEPNEMAAHTHLGDSYWQKGMQPEALAQWQTRVALWGDHPIGDSHWPESMP